MVSNLVVEIAIYNFDLFHYTLIMTPLPLVQWYQMVTKWYLCGTKMVLTLSTLKPSDVQVVSSDVHQVSTWPQDELSGCFCELTGIAWAQCYY